MRRGAQGKRRDKVEPDIIDALEGHGANVAHHMARTGDDGANTRAGVGANRGEGEEDGMKSALWWFIVLICWAVGL